MLEVMVTTQIIKSYFLRRSFIHYLGNIRIFVLCKNPIMQVSGLGHSCLLNVPDCNFCHFMHVTTFLKLVHKSMLYNRLPV